MDRPETETQRDGRALALLRAPLTALFLVQAAFITGETIHVNGGRFVLP